MNMNRRRKKRLNYGVKTVEIVRGSHGFGFTISGQQPCILSCIVANSPADQAGLRAGDFLISVNSISVSKMTHDAVVGLIATCPGPIRMTIAENYFSDSSDEEDVQRVGRRTKNKPRYNRRLKCENKNEYKALVGYLGTIEIPRELLPNSKRQTVLGSIKKLRQEKRTPTFVLLTILPTCLTLKNTSNNIVAIYPQNRVIYIGPTEEDSKYFGILTSGMQETEEEVSNACHVFLVDSKLIDHRLHLERANHFKISCTRDEITKLCLEFPKTAGYIVKLIRTLYKLKEEIPSPVMANSPQPSASSNSDSGIGYRDDCGNVSDRIVMVEFPTARQFVANNNNNEDELFRVPMVRKKATKKFVYSCEELRESHSNEQCPFGSLQDLTNNWDQATTRCGARSEPDVRMSFEDEQQIVAVPVPKIVVDKTGEGPAGWATSFEKLLDDPVGLHAFAEFLKKEFSAENIYFWTACERYRRLQTVPERHVEAQKIYRQHIANGATEAVNLDAQGVQAVEGGLAEARADIFEIAQKQIFNLIKFDSYPRFLKSQLYKQWLAGEGCVTNFDSRLALNNSSLMVLNTPTKLKKSLSNAEDRRRKSLLPWHRKTQRSRSKEREMLTQKSWDGFLRDDSSRPEIHSSHSSLTSLDLANQNESEVRTLLCRMRLANGSTTVVQIKNEDSVAHLVDRLLDKRGLSYSSYEVVTNKHQKPVDLTQSSTILAGCEAVIEQRVVFKLDLPNKKIISVKSKYTKIIVDVLRPILHKYKFSLDEVMVTRGGILVDVNQPVTAIDNGRLNVQLKEPEDCPIIQINDIKINKLDEITNRVFEGILQDKCEEQQLKNSRSDKGSVKSEDWGSEHSSGLLRKFLRRESTVTDKKKSKVTCPRSKLPNEELDQPKKPLIAKLKAGANKLHVAGTYNSESDELVEGLTRAQRRLEDQRGTEINFELPDFLKDQKPKGGPPPLPPKPKIVPIRPQNWGQSALLKAKSSKELFLEQTSGSFV